MCLHLYSRLLLSPEGFCITFVQGYYFVVAPIPEQRGAFQSTWFRMSATLDHSKTVPTVIAEEPSSRLLDGKAKSWVTNP